jgi:DNA-binding CsgD family transcriptional regulator
MSANENDNERSGLQILQEIISGLTDPKLLDKQGRQQCVELLIAEGYTYLQIGQLLKVSERTINNDVREIRARNELMPNLEFAKQFVGDLFQKAMNHHGFLVRLARAKDTLPTETIQAESAAWKILKELVEKLQTLGYLPSRPAEVVGTFYHQSNDVEDNSPESMRKMLLGIEEAARDAGLLDKDVVARIETLKARVGQSEIAFEIKQLEDKTLKEKEQEK